MTDPDAAGRAFGPRLAAATPEAAFAALRHSAGALVGARLFTVMTVDMSAGLARRAYSSDPVSYHATGTNPVRRDAWFEVVHGRHQAFVANALADIAQVFPDHEFMAPWAARRSSTCQCCAQASSWRRSISSTSTSTATTRTNGRGASRSASRSRPWRCS